MRPSPWKRRLVSAIRWSLLVDALVSASAGLLTIVPWPVWTPAMGGAWPVGMVVPEIALWLVPLPVCFAAAALWLGRRSGRWLTGITVVLCAALYAFFTWTRVGVAMQAASQNQLAAYYMGIPVKRMFSLIWAISAGVAAIAGVLLAPVSLIDINLGFIGLKAFAAAVLGGFGSIPGALVGGLTIGLIELWSGAYLPQGFKDVAAYVVLLLVLAVRPQGMFGTVGRKKV